ncbi:MAG: ATP-binding protein, partial [Bacteroidales bacterium]|nr:ATP-binding protein [Bacteroidales bacterium]
DFFSLFYLHFVKNKKGTNSDYWNSLADNAKHRAWTGFSFELLCQAHLEQIKQALGISGITSYTSGWRSRKQETSAQIDLIIDRNDNVINLCEMKFSNKEFIIDKNYDKILQHKKWAFLEETKTKKAIHITLISTYGIKQNEYWHNIQNTLNLQDLF